jgi:hypothetical protein
MLVLVLVLLLVGSALAPSAVPPDTKPPPWKLAEAKLDAATATCRALAIEYQDGRATYQQVAEWSRRWRDAQRDVKTKRAEQQTAYEEHVKRMEELEKMATDRFNSRKGLKSEIHAAEYLRIEAEMDLSRFRSSK